MLAESRGITSRHPDYQKIRKEVFEEARILAELEVKKVRGVIAEKLAKIASKIEGWGPKITRFLGGTSRRVVPVVAGGYVFYETGNFNRAIADATPIGWAIFAGEELIGKPYLAAQQMIEEGAFEMRYSERYYMGSAWRRQSDYEQEKKQRECP
jgi:hypothetical protein